MNNQDEALAFLEQQRQSGSTDWYNSCERLARTSYGLPPFYSSADLHAYAIPQANRFGHEPPSKGDLAMFINAGDGHIVVCTGVGWACYTNDFGGHGTVVKIPDLRVLAPWCHATEWFIADAWWNVNNHIETHGAEVALTDADISKIADAVWAKAIKRAWDGKDQAAGTVLSSAHYYAVSGGAIGTVPSTATSGPGSPTTSAQILNAAKDDGQLVIPDSALEKIATAVADKLAQRLTS